MAISECSALQKFHPTGSDTTAARELCDRLIRACRSGATVQQDKTLDDWVRRLEDAVLDARSEVDSRDGTARMDWVEKRAERRLTVPDIRNALGPAWLGA